MAGSERRPKITIITPPVAESEIDLDLVNLTRYIWETHHVGEPYGYGLGGDFGYGPYGGFANDVFEMNAFCWCEQEDCRWCGPENAPHFFHRRTGLAIRWYKWIGRSMEFEPAEPGHAAWRAIFDECVASVPVSR